MSRMILALCALMTASGCLLVDPQTPSRVSLVVARLETLGPNWSARRCNDCIPSRPYTFDFIPCWDYWITEHTAQKCAFRAYGDYKRQCGNPKSHHFKMGFIAAYEDLALNRRPSPRIVPPPKYWNAFYRSSAGRPLVDQWFAGYDAGLSMGSNSGVAEFREVYLNRGIFGSTDETGKWVPAVPNQYGDGPAAPMGSVATAPNYQSNNQPSAPLPTTMAPQPASQQKLPLRVLKPYDPYGKYGH